MVLSFLSGLIINNNVQAAESKYLDSTQRYLETLPIKDISVIKDYMDNSEPKIAPIITAVAYGTIGCMVITGAGASMPLVVIGTLSNGFIGYFYGYGLEAALDRYVSVPMVYEDKLKLKRQQLSIFYDKTYSKYLNSKM